MNDTDPPSKTPSLPRLRRQRRIDIPKLLGYVFEPIKVIDAQVEPYAQRWDEWNATELVATGPLWIVYGDSSSQGIGASNWDHGWVPIALSRLWTVTGEPWRVINLSMSGGRIRDVIDVQVPVADEHLPTPELVTCIVGSNDVFWRPGETDAIVADALELGAVLPKQTMLSQISGPPSRHKPVREAIANAAQANDLDLFDVWKWPSSRNALAADRVHPSDLGYQFMAELVWAQFQKRLDFDEPLTPRR